jgi:epoxide hydrolase-like predicted phosphatase
MPIQAIFTDVGGVLVRTANHDKRHEWEARLGLPEETLTRVVFGPDSVPALLGEMLEAEMWRRVSRKLGLSDAQIDEFRRDFFAGEVFDVELAQFIGALRPRVKTGIISNAWSDARPVLNAKFNLDSYVDMTLYSAEVKLAKPDPRIYQLALARLDVRAEDAVFIDDVLENVQAAQALGMRGVQFTSTQQVMAEIKGHLGHTQLIPDGNHSPS